jgi:threonine/homoserine/homoserine lactone efflux protein
LENLMPFLFAAFALTGSPGPNTLSLAAAGAAFGARRSVGFMLGLLVGMVLVMSAVAAGITGLVLAVPGALPIVTLLAAAYFLYLAWKIATAPPVSAQAGEGAAPSFKAGVFLSLVNPKAYAAMGALFSGFILVHVSPQSDALAKIVVLTVVIAIVNGLWLMLGAALTRFFRDPKTSRVINMIFAAALLASLSVTLFG